MGVQREWRKGISSTQKHICINYISIFLLFLKALYIYFQYAYMHIHIHIFLFIYFSYIHIIYIFSLLSLILLLLLLCMLYEYIHTAINAPVHSKFPIDDGHLAGGASCGCRSCVSVRRCDACDACDGPIMARFRDDNGVCVSEDVKYVNSKISK